PPASYLPWAPHLLAHKPGRVTSLGGDGWSEGECDSHCCFPLICPLSETALTKTRSYRHWIECAPYSDVKTCTKEYHPLCATNGCTYCNECFFCDALKLLTYSPIKETPQPAGVVGKADTVPGAAELALHGPLCRRPEKMAFFSSRVRALFILVLVLPLCSETGFARSKKTRKEPDCDVYRSHLFFCTREMDPICGTNGKSYANPCIFCSEKLGRNEKFDFGHWGHCREYTSAARS
uniref:Kazal-like domain-containing protein n=1 Tax=Sus scrofa TaxID=9823 RepID=A0A8D2CHF0_PIG